MGPAAEVWSTDTAGTDPEFEEFGGPSGLVDQNLYLAIHGIAQSHRWAIAKPDFSILAVKAVIPYRLF